MDFSVSSLLIVSLVQLWDDNAALNDLENQILCMLFYSCLASLYALI